MAKKWLTALLALVLVLGMVPTMSLQTVGQVGPPTEDGDDDDDDDDEEIDYRIPNSRVSVNGYVFTVREKSADDLSSVVLGGRTLRENYDYMIGYGTNLVHITLRDHFVGRLGRGRYRVYIYFTDGYYAEAFFSVDGRVYVAPDFSGGSSDPIDTRADWEKEPYTEDLSGMPQEGPPAAENINRNPGTGR